MYESSGNLAYSIPQKKKSQVHTRQYRKNRHADPKRVVFKEINAQERIAVNFHKQIARQRLGQIFGVICAASIIAITFAGILYQYSRIMELNYANVSIEREIKQIAKDDNQLKEELAKKTDLILIRTLAVERLGLQDPGIKQIVNVSIPVSDRVIIENNDSNVRGDDAILSNAFNNIEGFFKTIR